MLCYACGYKPAHDGQDIRALQHYLGTGTYGTRSATRRWGAAGLTASGRTNGPVASDRGEDARSGQAGHIGVLASQSKQRVETYREFRTVRLRTLAYKRRADPVGPADPPMLALKRLARGLPRRRGIYMTIRVRAGARGWAQRGAPAALGGAKPPEDCQRSSVGLPNNAPGTTATTPLAVLPDLYREEWRTRRDSNSRPLPSEGSALSS